MTVVLFSGHLVDDRDRVEPRFPPDKTAAARREIRRLINGVDDLEAVALSGAASGGDLIFCEEWLATLRRLFVYLPRPKEPFLDESVRFAGEEWLSAYERVVSHPLSSVVGPDSDMVDSKDPHSLNNLRMLEDARSCVGPLVGVFLWDGAGAEGPGGTAHMVGEFERLEGLIHIIDPADLPSACEEQERSR